MGGGGHNTATAHLHDANGWAMAMIISHIRRFAFVLVPKCGTNTMYQYLAEQWAGVDFELFGYSKNGEGGLICQAR